MLSDPDDQADLEAKLEGISLVIVDNLATLCRTGQPNDADSWLPIQTWALRLRAAGLSVLFIHHSGKNGGQRGTSAKEDILDTVIGLRRPSDYEATEGARFEGSWVPKQIRSKHGFIHSQMGNTAGTTSHSKRR